MEENKEKKKKVAKHKVRSNDISVLGKNADSDWKWLMLFFVVVIVSIFVWAYFIYLGASNEELESTLFENEQRNIENEERVKSIIDEFENRQSEFNRPQELPTPPPFTEATSTIDQE